MTSPTLRASMAPESDAAAPDAAPLGAWAWIPGLAAFGRGRPIVGTCMLTLTAGLVTLVAMRYHRLLEPFSGPTGPGQRTQTWESVVAIVSLLVAFGVLFWINAAIRAAPPRRRGGISEWQIVRRRFARNKVATAGLAILIVLYLVAVLAPMVANFDPTEQTDIRTNRLQPPNGTHWLGTDDYARDVFSRIVYGSRVSLFIGFVAVFLSLTIGSVYGSVSAYFGGTVDAVMMRLVDMLMSFPRLVLLLAISSLFETRSLLLIMLILGATGWMGVARIVRGQVLALKEQDFIQAARALGMRSPRIILRHLLPNAMAPVIVAATLAIGSTILVEAGLSFLGMGVPPPTATWGAMVNEGRQHIDFDSAYWISTYPGLMIVLAVVCFNLMGDGLRDALDPRLRGS